MKLERVLQKITGLIVDACDPDAILLFGSHAKGQADAASDLDFLVVGHWRMSAERQAVELRQFLYRFPIKTDVLCVSPEEVKAAQQAPYGFLGSVLQSSVVLYDRHAANRNCEMNP